MKKHNLIATLLTLVATSLALAAPPALGSEAKDEKGGHEITVMTQNLYEGAEFGPVIAAVLGGSPGDVVVAVAEVWAKVQSTDFPTRARGIASEIAKVQPDFVGLQEAVIWRSGLEYSINDAPKPATHVEYDFLATLLDALRSRGLEYEPVVISTGFDVEMPAATGPASLMDIRVTEREVLLARTGHGSKKNIRLTNLTDGHFATIIDFPDVGISVNRGWVSADALYQDRRFRIVSTHLEADSEEVRFAQAKELVAGPLDTDLSVILMGDTNSNAAANDGTQAAYQLFVGAGLKDAWKTALPGVPGYTCCQAESLRNPRSLLDQRIDLILYRGRPRLEDVDLLGERPSDRVHGLWPSDHASVAATFELK